MNNKPIIITQELIKIYGASLLEDPERLGQLLEDKCGDCRHEVFILSFALRNILKGSSLPEQESFEADREKLASRFRDELGFPDESAKWAVGAIGTIIASTEGSRSEDSAATPQAHRGFLSNIKNGMAKHPRSAPVRKKALRNGLLLLGIVVLLLTLFLRVMGSGFAGRDEYRLLFLSHLSGSDAALGHVRLKAAQLAVDQLNAQGGVKGRTIQIQGYDLPHSPQEAERVVSAIINEKMITAIISACSDESNLLLAKIADEKELPLIVTESGSTAVTMATEDRPRLYTFRLNSDNDYNGKLLAYFTAQGLGRKSAVVIHDPKDADSREVRDSFVKMSRVFGISISADIERESPLRPRGGAIDRMLSYGTGMLVLSDGGVAAFNLTALLRDGGFKGPILGGEFRSLQHSSVPKVTGDSWWILPASPDDPQLRSFCSAYMDKYNEQIADCDFIGALFSYDSVYWVADSLYRAPGLQGEAIRHALLSTKNLALTHATLTIDPRTHGPWNKAMALVYCNGENYRFQKRFYPR